MILQYHEFVRIGIIINGIDKETAILVAAVVLEQAANIAILQVDMLNGIRPSVFGNLVDHPQALHQILNKSKLHLVGTRVV